MIAAPCLSQSSTYLQNGQATVVLPDNLQTSSLRGAELANSTEWLGCIVAANALMEGTPVAVLDGIASAEQCCRACREWPDGACNVYNYCAGSQPGGCRWVDGWCSGCVTAVLLRQWHAPICSRLLPCTCAQL